jgi:hypothetical protein
MCNDRPKTQNITTVAAFKVRQVGFTLFIGHEGP